MSAAAKGAGKTPQMGGWHLGLRAVSRGWLVLCLVFLVLPLAFCVIASLQGQIGPFVLPKSYSLAAYGNIPGIFFSAAWTSARLALSASILALVVSLPAALWVGRRTGAGSRVFEALFKSSAQVPSIIIGVSLYSYYVKAQSVIGFGARGTFLGLLIGHFVLVEPYMFTTLTARAATLPADLEEAAQTLGASRWFVLWRVQLPLMLSAVVSALLLCAVLSFDDVAVSLFLIGPGVTTLSVAMYSFAEQSLSPVVFAVGVLTILAVFVVVVPVQRLIDRDRREIGAGSRRARMGA